MKILAASGNYGADVPEWITEEHLDSCPYCKSAKKDGKDCGEYTFKSNWICFFDCGTSIALGERGGQYRPIECCKRENHQLRERNKILETQLRHHIDHD